MSTTPAAAFSSLQLRLLDAIQRGIPLVERPFAQIGHELGITEAQTLDELRELKEGPRRVVRQISAIFGSRALGYVGSLVAARIEPERLDSAVAVLNAHPGVSHNYERNHAFNVWYTLAVPPDSSLGLERTAQRLHDLSGASVTRLLPTLKLYKIGVRLKMSDDSDDAPGVTTEAISPRPLSTQERQRVRVLQQDLPLQDRPFDDWARQAETDVPDLLASAQRFLDEKLMRRFSAVLRHRNAGFHANAMGAWAVGAEQADSFGEAAARFQQISHCYLRPTYEDWPYSIFTMVHGNTREACESVLAELSQRTGIRHYAALYSSREFKKVRVKYFTPEILQWEQQAQGEAVS